MNSGKGGTVCRFSVGEKRRSVKHLAYISREEAVSEGKQGVWLFQLPDEITKIRGYNLLRDTLLAYAWVRQNAERKQGGASSRTHYRCILSFERNLPTEAIREASIRWLSETFPLVKAACFLHRNTKHPHVHVWIEARRCDGRKLHLDARTFRQIDEHWNRYYAHAVGHAEQEHLLKKWGTEHVKQRLREGHPFSRPERVGHLWHPARFTERERERFKAVLLEATADDRDKSGIGEDQWGVAGDDTMPPEPEQCSISGEPAMETVARNLLASEQATDKAHQASEYALSKTRQLYETATRLADRTQECRRGIKTQDRTGLEPER